MLIRLFKRFFSDDSEKKNQIDTVLEALPDKMDNKEDVEDGISNRVIGMTYQRETEEKGVVRKKKDTSEEKEFVGRF